MHPLRAYVAFLVVCWVVGAAAPAAHAEQRLYVLRVTTRDGLRYETLSAEDPFTYASLVGGQIFVSRDYRRVWSPQVKVSIVDTWIEHRIPLQRYWIAILKERGLYASHNYRLLPRRPPLTDADMRVPEEPSAQFAEAAPPSE